MLVNTSATFTPSSRFAAQRAPLYDLSLDNTFEKGETRQPSLRHKGRRGSFSYSRPQRVRTVRADVPATRSLTPVPSSGGTVTRPVRATVPSATSTPRHTHSAARSQSAAPQGKRYSATPREDGALLLAPQWGHIVILLLLMVTVGVLAFTIVQLSGDPSAAIPSTLTTISVQPGDTLGSIASQYAPHADASAVVERIRDLNGLKSAAVAPGQFLVVPAGL